MRETTKEYLKELEAKDMPLDEITYLINELDVRAEMLSVHYSAEELATELQTHDNYLDLFDEDDIMSSVSIEEVITFENSNTMAERLSLCAPEVATALLDELLYWRETAGRI